LKQATHRRVLEAAFRLFRQRGYAGTAVREIADEAHVSVGTVMKVGDKDALLVQVFDEMVETVHLDRMDLEIAAVPDGTDNCADRLVAIVRPFVDLFTDNAALARAYAAILVSGRHCSRLFTVLADHLVQEFGTVLESGGCTPSADTYPKARALYAAYTGTLLTAAAQDLDDPKELLEQLHATFGAICVRAES
jgi:AcrR family transcriptional regulator